MFLLLLLIGFFIYLYLCDGRMLIQSKHFIIDLSKENIKEFIDKKTKPENTCSNCGVAIPIDKVLCQRCQEDEINNYSSDYLQDNTTQVEDENRVTLQRKFKL